MQRSDRGCQSRLGRRLQRLSRCRARFVLCIAWRAMPCAQLGCRRLRSHALQGKDSAQAEHEPAVSRSPAYRVAQLETEVQQLHADSERHRRCSRQANMYKLPDTCIQGQRSARVCLQRHRRPAPPIMRLWLRQAHDGASVQAKQISSFPQLESQLGAEGLHTCRICNGQHCSAGTREP